MFFSSDAFFKNNESYKPQKSEILMKKVKGQKSQPQKPQKSEILMKKVKGAKQKIT